MLKWCNFNYSNLLLLINNSVGISYCNHQPCSYIFKIFSNKVSQFFVVVSGSRVFLCHKMNAFCQLFNDTSILQSFCSVLIPITFSGLSPYSSFPFSSPFLDHLYNVKILFTLSRVFVMFAK